MSGRHRIYYCRVSARTIKTKRRRLTLKHYILKGLFVSLTLAADLVSKARALMSEGLTMLACLDLLHQLTLDTRISNWLTRGRINSLLHRFSSLDTWPRVTAHNPLLRMCSMSSDCCTLDTTCQGEGSSSSEAPTLDSPSLGTQRLGRVRGAAHYYQLDNPTSSNPCLHNLEGLHEVA